MPLPLYSVFSRNVSCPCMDKYSVYGNTTWMAILPILQPKQWCLCHYPRQMYLPWGPKCTLPSLELGSTLIPKLSSENTSPADNTNHSARVHATCFSMSLVVTAPPPPQKLSLNFYSWNSNQVWFRFITVPFSIFAPFWQSQQFHLLI